MTGDIAVQDVRTGGPESLIHRLTGRGPVGVACAAIAILGAAVGASGVGVAWLLLICSLGTAVACAPDSLSGRSSNRSAGRRRLSVVGWLPMGFLIVVVIFTILALVAGYAHVSLWAERGPALATWAVVNFAIAAACVARGGRVRFVRGDVPAGVSFIVLWVIGIAVAVLQPFEVWARNVNWSSDFVRHLVLLRRVADAGNLVYNEDGYPKGLHTTVAGVWSAAGGELFANAWQSLESVLWLVICLMGMALVITAGRVSAYLRLPEALGSIVVPAVVVLAFVQGAWITAILPRGFVTSILAGLAVAAAMASATDGAWLGSFRSVAVLTVATVALCHSWPVLAAVTAGPLLLSLVVAVKRKALRWPSILAVLLGISISLPPTVNLLSIRAGQGDTFASSAKQSFTGGLETPDWWWYVAALLAVLSAVVAWRAGIRSWSASWFTMALLTPCEVVFVVLTTGGTWPDLGYFALKTLWTLSVLVLPAAVVGGAWVCVQVADRVRRMRGGAQLAMLCGIAAVLGVLGSAVARGVVSQPWLPWREATGALGTETYQIPVVSAIERTPGQIPPGRGVLPYGVAPWSKLSTIETAGNQDLGSYEALRWFGIEPDVALANTLPTRYAPAICQYLRVHPDAVRVTGPNTEPGIGWLRESGCPDDVIKPDSWIMAPLNHEWYQGILPPGTPFIYPTWDQYQEYLKGIFDKGKKLPLPRPSAS